MTGRIVTILLALLAIVQARTLHAELRFGPFSWAATQDTLVVTTPDENSPGVFIGRAPGNTRTQELSPNYFFEGKGSSAFLRYDRKRNAFTELLLGNGRSYPIGGGGFTFKVDQTRIAVNPVSELSKQPYWTISVEGKYIKGYVGLQEVFSLTGSRAVGYLEANQNFSEEASALHDYSLSDQGELLLDKQLFKGDLVGVLAAVNNDCLEKPLPVEYAGAEAKNPSSKADWLIIGVRKDALQVYDISKSAIGIVKQVERKDGPHCVFSAVDVTAPEK
ncbi:MAG: hypothetical protein K1X79_08860 [Oligoflexia bacterium]|nr:hypothetical protein [Oligoflexia bacterium]